MTGKNKEKNEQEESKDNVATGTPNDEEVSEVEQPARQFFIPSQIIETFSKKGKDHLETNLPSQFVLSLKAGSFMTFGAVFSILLMLGIHQEGLSFLLSGLGFATGYAMVFISGSILFTEVNVLLPSYIFQGPYWIQRKFIKFWISTWLGNIIGALFVALLIYLSQSMTPHFGHELDVLLHHKMKFTANGVWGWFQVMISGIIANWLIGMAAFLTTAARDLVGKFVGTALPVILFVAGNFQHSAANMGYFSLAFFMNHDYTWYQLVLLNLIPASIGNIIGGAIMVSLVFSFAYRKDIGN